MPPLPKEDRDELLRQLHEANQRVHDARVEWEKALDSSDYGHEKHVEVAHEKLLHVEREVEAIEARIGKTLG